MYRTPRRFVGGAFCVLFVALGGIPFARAFGQAPGEIIEARDVKIGMGFGAPLHAHIYRPSGNGLHSTVFSLEVDTTAAREQNARALAAAGYAVVIAAPRGGDDRHIGRDGYDAIEWINDQSWSDRRIVMAGTGEGANAAWNAARAHPPHLAAILARAPSRPLGWTDVEVQRVVIPALSIAGSAGDAQGYAVDAHARYARAVRSGGAPIAYLVIGSLAAPQLDLLERQWIDWAAGRGPISPLLRKRVNYLVVNEGTWLAADSLAAIGARPTSFPLHSNAGPRVAPGGFLGEAPRDDEPADTVEGDKTYETLLGAPLDLAGSPTVTLWLRHEPPHEPLVPFQMRIISLDEVLADGTAVSLGSSGEWVRTADTTAALGSAADRVEFKGLPWVARRLAAGSKLRLTVNGAPTVIYHDNDRYSRVTLPVVKH
jgi:hypothetical protein